MYPVSGHIATPQWGTTPKWGSDQIAGMKNPNRLAELRVAADLTQEEAAEAMGLSLGGYRKLEYGERRLKLEQIHRAAEAFSVTFAEVGQDVEAPSSSVPVMGYIGAGAEIDPDMEQVPPEGLDQVEVPFAIPDGIIAFEVRGESMYPRYDPGDVLLVYKEQQRPTSSLISEDVAVKVEGGGRFLKRLMRGTKPNTFNLESWNARTIESVRLDWIGEVYLTLRSGQVKRIELRERKAATRRATARAKATEGMDELPLQPKRAMQL